MLAFENVVSRWRQSYNTMTTKPIARGLCWFFAIEIMSMSNTSPQNTAWDIVKPAKQAGDRLSRAQRMICTTSSNKTRTVKKRNATAALSRVSY